MNRTNLINYIIKNQGYTEYVEIGLGTGRNFEAIKCKNKSSVDPDPKANAVHKMTSDDFFNVFNKVTEQGWKDVGEIEFHYDIIFLDGLHHADQLRKDIINAWECLFYGGCLVIHDTNPDREEITHVPRDSKEWCGDVYKAIYQVNNDKFTLKDDHGVTVIRKTGELIINDSVIDWPEFNEFRNEILNLKTWEECVNLIEGWK